MSEEIKDLRNSFNKMKDTLYTNTYSIKKYQYSSIAEILAKENKTKEEYEFLEDFHFYIRNLRDVIEDVGTSIVTLRSIDFNDKNQLESFARDLIDHIDRFIDTVVAINQKFNLASGSDIDTKMSEHHLKSLRSKFLKKVNEFRMKFDVNIDKAELSKFKVLISDLIDDMIKESISLRVKKLDEVLQSQLNKK